LISYVSFLIRFVSFVAPVLILGRLVAYVSDPNPQVWHGIIYVSALFFAGFTGSVAWNNYFFYVLRAGQHVRSVLVELVYEKSFRLSNEERRKYTSGEIVNFASVDAKRIGNFWQWVHVFWSSPLQLILALIGLFSILGPSALAGVGVMILVLPLTYWVQRKTGEYQDTMMKHKDSRVKLLNEALQAIRVIKFFAWEEKFTERIEALRSDEVRELLWIKFMGALTYVIWRCLSGPFFLYSLFLQSQ
jgi:ABC-type multidrug transport system fused ATPase/permease subunit